MKLHLYVLCLFMSLPFLSFAQAIVATEVTDNPKMPAGFNVHANCLKHFSHTFKNTTDARWSQGDEGYGVHFSENEILYDVRYNHRGRWITTIRYIPAHLLSKKVADVVQSEYRHYNIF